MSPEDRAAHDVADPRLRRLLAARMRDRGDSDEDNERDRYNVHLIV